MSLVVCNERRSPILYVATSSQSCLHTPINSLKVSNKETFMPEDDLNKRYIFYVDDFGTRATCKGTSSEQSTANEFSFALGGVIVAEEDVAKLSLKVEEFCNAWSVPSLHGNKIRTQKGKFSFLKHDKILKTRFFDDLEKLVLDPRLIVHGCVICRPGYRDRYASKYPEGKRWAMSKTAFDISVERAVKFAVHNERQLDVVFERSGKKEDQLLRTYFSELKTNGMSFDNENSKRYRPLNSHQLGGCLNKIWSDNKSNQLLQLADLMVHPIAHNACGKENRAYLSLEQNEMLLDFKHPDSSISIKYSCFDGKFNLRTAAPKNTRDPEGSLETVGVKPNPVA